ncbi:MAG: helix-turn-helix domain-containing protein [Pseudonocardiaceae bacterium]
MANTRGGLAAVHARGRAGGRRPWLSAHQVALAQQLYDAGEHTVQQIADMFSVPRSPCRGIWTRPESASDPSWPPRAGQEQEPGEHRG